MAMPFTSFGVRQRGQPPPSAVIQVPGLLLFKLDLVSFLDDHLTDPVGSGLIENHDGGVLCRSKIGFPSGHRHTVVLAFITVFLPCMTTSTTPAKSPWP
ncbi:hypothetical protein CMUS01_14999 [Colletotrichum musicola]|uniref:Uncharacterized protein n=1 Tax=Colletotrichum musicola TaxID=2175873 RepID=A0A8H6MPS4_9PEZI|nr:hypothetical protein CMUS01_14999 [Colletotrichum musicola]